MTFEDNLIKGIDHNQERLSPLMKEAHERAKSLFSDYQIQESDFVDTYGQETIGRDLSRISSAEKSFGEPDSLKQVSEVLEGIILKEGEMSEWFGPGVETMKTSRFDDYFNGTDLILEIVEDTEDTTATNLALGVDVTFTTSGSLGEKIDRIMGEIEEGKSGTIKYFKSDRLGFEGRMIRVPHIVIGLEKGNVERLAQLWVNGNKKDMAEHPAQRVILEEIKLALESFSEYAESIRQEEIALAYKKALAVVNIIIEGKEVIDFGDLANDRVFNLIRAQMLNIKDMADKRMRYRPKGRLY